MPLQIQPLPCDPLSFAPQFSVEGIDLHRRQQQAQLDAIAAILGGEAEAEDLRLDDLARRARGMLAAHAAQAWCDGFYWEALRAPRPEGANAPGGRLAEAICGAFGDAKRLRERFDQAAQQLAGPGWVWLAQRRDGRLAILATPQSVTPLTGSDTPLLAFCLWPHAYAHDYGDSRERYLAAFWQLVDWDKVASRLQ
ncbi:superoxide dismutase [Luteimonas viscosa]|uniref:superoxide dismutase n=1 Tax=Luteimonas viscosa TaxID=1132694 RepID=A0A5D4XRJ2_9GAMM|nr:superoxide dismutase [Luteimonas viscosa]TYT27216.1 superoxide dismutase [Luteimonas viscosa]